MSKKKRLSYLLSQYGHVVTSFLIFSNNLLIDTAIVFYVLLISDNRTDIFSTFRYRFYEQMKQSPQIEPDRQHYTAICITQMIKSRQKHVAFIKMKRATYGKFVQQRKLGESGLKHTARKRG